MVHPEDPKTEGNAWGQVECVNEDCVANPRVNDGELVADERGSDAYKAIAIARWNTREGLCPVHRRGESDRSCVACAAYQRGYAEAKRHFQ